MKLLTLSCCLLFLLNVSSSKKEEYTLVWSDEFNKDGAPDPTNWNFENGFVRNHELQYYQPENAWCEKGNLVIEARKENKPNPGYVEGSNDWRKNRPSITYTSTSMRTMGQRSWQYGRFEMRARIDISAGVWPAWWTLGVSKRWPANGEIDIMEYYRGMLLANIACAGPGKRAEWFSNRFSTDSLGGEKWSSQFHIWKMDWNEAYIALFLDDVLLNKVPMEKLENKDGSGFNPFKQPHYMLLNVALGGDNGGSVEKTSFPRRMEVDYVRVYQKRRDDFVGQ